MRVFISYGLVEGSAHSKKLRRALEDSGYSVTPNIAEAEAVIAHSGGCFMLDGASQARAVLLVGLPYWPGKKLSSGVRQKVALERKDLPWFKKTGWHIVYLFGKLGTWIRMYKHMQRLSLTTSDHVTLVRNEHDTYLEAAAAKQMAQAHGWNVVELPGQHDDIWSNPEPYVKLLGTI